MLKEISFKHYKLFKNKQNLVIKPLTIVIGKNNTGKSSILKLLILLESALNTKEKQLFDLNYENQNLAEHYKDLIYGKFSRGLEIGLKFNTKSKKNNEIKFTAVVRPPMNNENDLIFIEHLEINKEINLEYLEDSIYLNSKDNKTYKCTFQGLNFTCEEIDNSQNHFSKKVELDFNTNYISSLRENSKKYYEFEDNSIDKIGINGSNAYQILVNDSLTTDKTIYRKVQNWIKEQFEGWELIVKTDSEPYTIWLKKEKLEINIIDTGIGISQSLPIIINSFINYENQTLSIIEEPESHLHPYAHAQLAELIAKSITNTHHYLIETHSLNFILRIRRMIAEKKMKNEDVSLYYVDFNEENNESELKQIVIDEGGGVNWWPEGIFSESSIETRAILNARLNDINVGNVDKIK